MRRFLRRRSAPTATRWSRPRTAREGLAQAAGRNPDVILLDLGLPDGDGLEVARAIRRVARTPIIVLSARGQEHDKVTRARSRRGRLPDQAVRRGRAAGAHAGGAPARRAAGRMRRRAGVRGAESCGSTCCARRVVSRRRGGAPHADGVQAARRAGAAGGTGGHPSAAAPRGLGRQLRGARPITCGSTWRSSGTSSSATRRGLASSRPNPASGIVSANRRNSAGQAPPGDRGRRAAYYPWPSLPPVARRAPLAGISPPETPWTPGTRSAIGTSCSHASPSRSSSTATASPSSITTARSAPSPTGATTAAGR